jgi:pimeloyl-ACP methyl ester carboxylesterase
MNSQLAARTASAIAAAALLALGFATWPPLAAATSTRQSAVGCEQDFGTSTPVLLVHGFRDRPATWAAGGSRSMVAQIGMIPGVKVVTPFDYSQENTNWVTDPAIGPKLAAEITCLARTSANHGGPGKVIVVAHSMGGLAVRCALDPGCSGSGAARASQLGLVVTLDTPNLGSPLGGSAPAKMHYKGGGGWLSTLMLGVCDAIPGCRDLLLVGPTTQAARAMALGSRETRKLQPLPQAVPVFAVAGKITVTATLFSHRLPYTWDAGDGVVLEDSALAEAPAQGAQTGPHTGPGSGRAIEPCGTINLDAMPLWPATVHPKAAPGTPLLKCWHESEITNPVWQAAVVEAIQAATTTPALYIHNGFVLGSLFKVPNFPATIGLDNHDYLSGLHWSGINPSGATAKGTLTVDTCTPNCASGTTATYPVELLASNPQHCTVAVYKQYSSVSKQEKAYVFNTIRLRALSGNPPSNLMGSTSTLPPACSSVPSAPVTGPTPTAHGPSPRSTSPSPKSLTGTVTIPANGGWVDTGLSLNGTDSVNIQATGSWTPDGVNYTGPDGFGTSILSADNYINLSDLGVCGTCATSMYPEWAALMSYTGSSPPQPGSYTSTAVASQARLVDYVGSKLTTANWPYKGELWLGINDDAYSAYTSDNSGQVTALLTVTRP